MVWRIILLCVSGFMLFAAFLSGLGQMFNAGNAGVDTAGAVGSVFLAITGFVGLLIGGRGVATIGDRVAVIAINGVLAGCLALATVTGLFTEPRTDLSPQATLAFIALIIVIVVSLLLPLINILAVSNMPRPAGSDDPDGPQRSRTGGLIAGLIGGVMLAVCVITAVVPLWFNVGGASPPIGVQGGSGGTPSIVPTGREEPPAHVFEEFNFTWQPPVKPWLALDRATLTPNAALLYRRQHPEMLFTIIPEHADGITLPMLREIALANLQGGADSAEVLDSRVQEHHGQPWHRMNSRAQIGKRDFTYVHWMTVHGGFAYQLVTWARSDEAAQISQAADELMGRFELIDPDRPAIVRDPLAPWVDDRFGIKVDLSLGLWQPWNGLATDQPEAAFGALRGDGAFLLAFPVVVEQTPVSEAQTVHAALLSTMDFEYPGAEITDAVKVQRGEFDGIEYRATRALADVAFDMRIQVVQAGRHAHMLAVWWKRGNEAAEGAANAALDSVHLYAPEAWTSDAVASLSEQERRRLAAFNNRIGLVEYERLQFGLALESFQRALAYRPDDPVYFTNVIDTLGELGRYRDAANVLIQHAEDFEAVPSVLERDARFQELAGNTDRAVDKYRELFAGGYRNDEMLGYYLNLLVHREDLVGAEQAVEQYAVNPDRDSVLIGRADLLMAAGQYAEARALLATHGVEPTVDVSALEYLLDLSYDHKAYSEGIDAGRVLVDNGAASANTHYLIGLSELELMRYDDARTSFESALALAPQSELVQQYVAYVAELLGEGETRLIAQEIPPVAFPAELASVDLPQSWLDAAEQSHGAADEVNIVAIEFRPGDVHRTTVYSKSRVLSPRGRDVLGTFRFSFDPLLERMYVNHLIVRDAEGNVVHEGRRADWYVLSESPDASEGDQKSLRLPVVALRPGHVVDLAVTRERRHPPEELPFEEFALAHPIPTGRSAVFLNAEPTGYAAHSSPEVNTSQADPGTVWSIDRPPVYAWESRQPLWQEFLPRLVIAAPGKSWDDLAAAYLDDVSARLAVTDEIRETANRIVEGLDRDEDRIRRLAEFVQQELYYRAIAFGPRAWMPQPVERIIHDRVGDCKDHSLLLHALLNSIGISSDLALVSSGGRIVTDLPSLDQFDHMVLYVPSLGDAALLDDTDKYSDVLASVPLQLALKQALVLSADNPRLMRIPDYDPDAAGTVCIRTIRFSDDRSASVEESIEFNGLAAARIRMLLETLAPDDRRNYFSEWLLTQGVAARVDRAEIVNLDRPSKPLKIELHYVVKQALELVGDRARLALPALWERDIIETIETGVRNSPFQLGWPVTLRMTTIIELPSAYRVDASTMDSLTGDIDGRFWVCTRDAEQTGETITLQFHARRTTGIFPAEDYVQFIGESEAVLAPIRAGIVLLP